MTGLYVVQLDVQNLAERVQPKAKVCGACAAGHHELFLPTDERCDCPCHGSRSHCVDNKVAV
jgi:hypothetical protein